MIVKMGFVRRARAETFGSGRGMVNKLAFYNRIFFTTNNPRTVIACTNFTFTLYFY